MLVDAPRERPVSEQLNGSCGSLCRDLHSDPLRSVNALQSRRFELPVEVHEVVPTAVKMHAALGNTLGSTGLNKTHSASRL